MHQIEVATAKAEEAAAWLAECVQVDQVLQLEHLADAAVHFARQQKAATSAHANAWELKQRCSRRIGQLTAQIPHKPAGRPPKAAPTAEPMPEISSSAEHISKGSVLESMGISRKQASEYEQAAALPAEEFDARVAAGRASIETTGTAPKRITAVTAATVHDGDSWGTPPIWLELARAVMGSIELDPCSNERAQAIVQAEHYWTKDDDGLADERDWTCAKGGLWCNPPYSNPACGRAIKRFLDAHAAGQLRHGGMLLINNTTDTGAVQRALRESVATFFPAGRIGFLGPDGKPVEGTRQGQALFYVGEKLPALKRAIKRLEIEGALMVHYA